MKPFHAPLLAAALGLVACGYPERVSPTVELDEERHPSADDDPGEDCARAEVCAGGEDEDCDGFRDCNDEDCFGLIGCPRCGEVDLVEDEPLALPDGVGGAYARAISIADFGAGQTADSVADLLGVCVVMEHSWLRDLEIAVTCPSGQRLLLQEFLGQRGEELLMGEPNDGDAVEPTPGVGAAYCWTPAALAPPMLEWADAHADATVLPPGDYQAIESFEALVGCPLNGDWTIEVIDRWAADNGFIFAWGVRFESAIVEDCSTWVE